YGKTLEEAFTAAAYAYADTVSDHARIKKNIKKNIDVESEDDKSLLYDFIEQFIILLDTDDFLLAEIISIKITKKENKHQLTAEAVGDDKPENYEINTHVKAMTYQEMKIEETDDGFMIQAVLDI
ncbi:archease, partial [Candidatus Woesearchaeota archaeon]|nr:archease [Candidatus Woesearchaeota archaeon]